MTIKFNQVNAPERILLITAERVGDTLFTLPGIRLLKQSLPATRLDVVTFSQAAASLLAFNTDVAQIKVNGKGFALKKRIYDYPYVINLMHEMLKHVKEQPKHFLSIGKPDESKHRTWQVIEFIQTIVQTDGGPLQLEYPLYPQPADHQYVKHILDAQGVDLSHHKLVGIQLGCHRTARRGWKFWNNKRHMHKKVWPIENYIELAKALKRENPHIKIMITGSQQENYLARMFLKVMPDVVNMIGKTSLLQLAVLMDFLQLFITHDTGNLHIACARRTALIALFSATPVSFTGPFPENVRNTVLQSNRIEEIKVTQVYSAAKKILGL